MMRSKKKTHLRRMSRSKDARFQIEIVVRTAVDMLLTPLMYAIKLDKNVDFIEMLIESRGQVNAIRSPRKLTALHLAHSKDVVSLLLDYNANIYLQDSEGRTPIMKYLTDGRDENCVLTLLRRSTKESVNIVNNNGESAIAVAIQNFYSYEVIFKLIEVGAEIYGKEALLLTLALKYCDDIRIVKILVKHGVDVNYVDIFGNTVLHAVYSPTLFNTLINYGAAKFINYKNLKGDTPLLVAVKNCKDDSLVKLLLLNGADPNVRDSKGRTPAFFIVSKVTLPLLILFGADLTLKDHDDKNAWDFINATRLSHNNSSYLADHYTYLIKILYLLDQRIDSNVRPYLKPMILKFDKHCKCVIQAMEDYNVFGCLSLCLFCKILKFGKGFPVVDGLDRYFLKGVASRWDFCFYKDIILTQSEKYRLFCFESNLRNAVRRLKIVPIKHDLYTNVALSNQLWSLVVDNLTLPDMYSLFVASVGDDYYRSSSVL